MRPTSSSPNRLPNKHGSGVYMNTLNTKKKEVFAPDGSKDCLPESTAVVDLVNSNSSDMSRR
jgi:hypothetical protein